MSPETQTFTIPGRLASANELIAGINRNRFVGNTIKRKNTEICALAAVAEHVKPMHKPVRLEIHWFEPNLRRDIDNVAFGVKFILDGLVEARKLNNDTREWVTGISHHFPPPDKRRPRIEVTLIEA